MKFHLLLWLFLINLSINVFVVTGHCLGGQRSLLLHLKSNLSFDSAKSKKLIHWNQTGDCCQWNGVTCNNGGVIGLDLSEEFISGGLENANSLFNLQYLQNLNLAYNEFNSMIPSKVGALKSLRSLNFSNAGFKGQVPIEISHLKRLVVLDMSTSFNSIHALKLEKPNIALLLKNLTEIKELILDGVSVFGKGKEWSQALSSLTNLRVLSMSSCNLSGPIDSALERLHFVSIIRLNQNNLSSSVPESFANFSYLTTLELNNCGLSGVFPEYVFHIQSLQVLDLSNNQDLYGSLPNFPKQGPLHTLNLSNTNFLGLLPNSIHNLRQLSTLDLSKCQFNGMLPKKMIELTHLVHLDLSLNNFIGPLPSFNQSKHLRYLFLYHNNFQGSISIAHLEGLTNLAGIDIADNFLNGSVPSYLFTLPSLREIILSNNGFDGQLDDFPNASSSPVEIIDLSRNNLHGPIPVSIFHLGRLACLQLSFNKFSGTIKLDFIQNLGNLSTLSLSYNNLSVDATFKNGQDSSFPNMRSLMLASCNLKEFPYFLRNQSQLLVLDLSRNQIQGAIPKWISRFELLASLNLSHNFLTNFEEPFQNISSNLMVLDLNSNKLQGPIHIFPKYALYLDYSNNNLSSIVPNDIGNQIPFTFLLSIANNFLSGEIHPSFCNASSLQALDLSYNNFNGEIPKCLIANKNLKVLKLEGNELIGHISDTISSSCALRFLDLTGNLLSGTIPKSLSNCQKLRILNLGHNMFTDGFPCHLRNISTLRILTLRSNKLHGPIGCPNDIGNWKMLQIVDLASNDFFGELPAVLLRAWTSMTSSEDEVRPKVSVSDVYDTPDLEEFLAALSITNKDLAKLLVKVVMFEPRSFIEYQFSNIFYEFLRSDQVSVTVVNKGQEMKLVKIITNFTSVDFSSNHFGGPIPKELMNFKALHALNLSHNAFSGCIPSSIANLKYLESLDLSFNSLSGKIPSELSTLSFLAFVNLSFNNFVGEIPKGTQIQSFDATSFEGNEGLCGPPLTPNCSTNDGVHVFGHQITHSIDWNFLSAELGFTFGLGLVILPLIFLRQWRLWYCKLIDDILHRIFPQLAFVYELHGSKTYRVLRWRPY